MSKTSKKGIGRIWLPLVGGAMVLCLAGMIYSLVNIQRNAGDESVYRMAAEEMRQLSRQIAETARATGRGEEESFAELSAQVARFETALMMIDTPELREQTDRIGDSWEAVESAAQVLVDAGPRMTYLRGVDNELSSRVPMMQAELGRVVAALEDGAVSPATALAAQKTLWLTERIARNVERIADGARDSQRAADEFRTDAEAFISIVEALTRGDTLVGIERIRDARTIDAVSSAFRMFSSVATSVDRIADSAPELRQAAAARATIAESGAELGDAVLALGPSIDRLALGRLYDRGNLITLFVAPGILAIGLVGVLLLAQRRRARQTREGIEQINDALRRIAQGDLSVKVEENNVITREIAGAVNSATDHQRELVRNILKPFELSVEEINKIGITARGQVEKAQELTRSVGESADAATEMVRISEEIKKSTAEASRTSERNSEQVARGYELTQDMSRASAAVRESVQETSKSAKRQGELIQSVTAAAEYIQALNTKISVVAINTRIEAEKAGEYGRPFLGIADSIADLLREAEGEGRKIISEVRTLQNMSADNLASMETTVGTVVSILEYIERLDSSLEEINAGSSAISQIIRSVDDAAAKSALSALHMNSSMTEIRQRNKEIVGFSEATQQGVTRLQKSMFDASHNLGTFRIEARVVSEEVDGAREAIPGVTEITEVYGEEEMSAMESAPLSRASV
jgi:methyl-accepting chemotaxis protein